MSDIDAGAVSAPAGTVSAPQSSSEIAASVVNEAEHAESSTPDTDSRIDTTTLSEATTEPKTEPTPAELSAAAKFLEKQGHRLKKDDGRDVWLPAKTVEKMLDRYVEDHRNTWNGERTTIESRAKQYEDHLNTLRASFAGDTRAFIAEIAKVDPRYAAFLEDKAAAAAPTVAEEMPSPDITLPDGSQTYSLKGLQTLLEWNTTRVEGKLDERLKPYAEREKADKARAEQSKAFEVMQTRTTQQITEAKSWPGFAEHESDILKALQDDSAKAQAAGARPQLSLEGAYRQVVMAHMLEDDNARRERLLKEIQAASKSPALSRQTADTTRAPGPRTSAQIAREAIAKLEAGS